MKKTVFILIAILLSVVFFSAAQNKGDSKIIIYVSDTAGLYERIRVSFAKADFILKGINRRDTITTFPRDLKSMSGVSIARVSISGKTVVLEGFYSRKKIPLMMKVAKGIGSDFKYSD